MKQKFAQGIFMWGGEERRSNRYGFVYPTESAFDGVGKCAIAYEESYLTPLVGKRVRVVCKVIATRDSGHAGDRVLNIFPTEPSEGEVIELGVGTLRLMSDQYVGEGPSGTWIGLEPGDGRQDLWLSPEKLYRLHDQSVEFYIEPVDDNVPDSPVSPLITRCRDEACISNGDGTIQVKTKQASVKIAPTIESLADTVGAGSFIVKPPPSAVGNAGHEYQLVK